MVEDSDRPPPAQPRDGSRAPRGDVAVGTTPVPRTLTPLGDHPARPDGGAGEVFLIEGRPGGGLAGDLAQLRRQELPSGKEADEQRESGRRVMPLWQELPLLLLVAFCVAILVRSFLVQAFVIPSSSMEQTLLVGDRVLVNKVVYSFREPRQGEVIVFRGTDRWVPESAAAGSGSALARVGDTLGDLVGISKPGDKDFIKRVIGVPGDRVACCDLAGRVTVNGVALDEPYLSSNSNLAGPPAQQSCLGRRFDEVVVGPGQLFVMGDNRGDSRDSRCQGTVPIDQVIGRAFFVVWPSDRWGGVGGAPSPVTAALGAAVGAAVIGLPVSRRSRSRARTLRR